MGAESEVRPAFVSPDASVEATNTEHVSHFHKRSQSVALDPNDLHSHQIEKLQRDNEILLNSKNSHIRKATLQQTKMQKKVERLEKELKKREQEVKENQKLNDLLRIRLREFLQKNFKDLPVETFDSIEEIISEAGGGGNKAPAEQNTFGMRSKSTRP